MMTQDILEDGACRESGAMRAKSFVVFSHGFGVRSDGGGRGVFFDIARGLGEGYQPVMFDYNEISDDGKTIRVHPFSHQAEQLSEAIASVRRYDPGAVIDLVAHSQGCVAAALACPEGIRRAVFLAPPLMTDIGRSLARYEGKPDAVIDLEGESRLPRTDGTVTIVPSEYWQERVSLDYPALYAAFSAKTELHIVLALADEVLGSGEFPGMPEGTDVVTIPGAHDFTGTSRAGMVKEVVRLLS